MLVLLALAPAALIHGSHPAANRAVQRASVLVIATLKSPGTLDPAKSSTLAGRMVGDNVFNTLFTLTPSGTLTDTLATGATGGSKTLDVQIASRHLTNGRLVTPSLIARALSRTLWPSVGSPKAQTLLADIVGSGQVIAGKTQWISGIQVTGPKSLTFHLKKSDPGFLYNLASPYLAIVPVRDLSQGGPFWPTTNLIGSGGYRLTGWAPQSSLSFLAQGVHVGPRAINLIQFNAFNTAALALINHQVDAVPVPWNMANIAGQPQTRHYLRFLATGGTVSLVVNAKVHSAWMVPGVAQAALGGLTDRRWVKKTFQGLAPASTGHLSSLVSAFPSPLHPFSKSSRLPALPLAVNVNDPMGVALAHTLSRLEPGRFTVSVLPTAVFRKELTSGALAAAITTVWPGQSTASKAVQPVAVSVCRSGVLWLLASNLSGVTVFQDGALNWHHLHMKP